MRTIGYYTGQAINDSIACLDHAPNKEWERATAMDFSEGFICDLCGNSINKEGGVI
jgi:hypothetical protein